MRVGRRFLSAQDGAALVELAFALPIFLLLVWGVIDFGRLLWTANSLASAVREGARYAAVLPSPSGSTGAIQGVVERMFSPLGGPALTSSEVVVLDSTATSGNVTVQVKNYPFPTITPLGSLIGDTVSFTRTATFRWERASL